MSIVKPEPFNIKDLFIDVRLEAFVGNNDESIDFTGKKLFTTEFFKKGIGFGITNIDVEVNTSLQPVIEITFKDLFGNTIYGADKTFKVFGREAADSNADYSSLFNWPPPKFVFSFKGYLGKPVKWILNLQTTNVSYVSSDGSYDIKCTFVPNLWGIFGDIPMSYLKAVKPLKGIDNNTQATSIYDLVHIGKAQEVESKEVSSKYETVLNKLKVLNRDIASSLITGSAVDFGESIFGKIDGTPIQGFIPIKIPNPTKVQKKTGNEFLAKEGDINSLPVKSNDLNALSNFLLYIIEIGQVGSEKDETAGFVLKDKHSYSLDSFLRPSKEIAGEIKKVQNTIEANIEKIAEQKDRDIKTSTKTLLEKLTIGTVLGQIAGDTGYILGSILEAGFKGYSEKSSVRNQLDVDKKIIGKYYPLEFDDDGKEIPASNVGTIEQEFVSKFIDAIAKGVAEDVAKQDVGGLDGNSFIKQGTANKITKRVNNLEILSNNPYLPFYSSIFSSIIARSGIVGYVTRSDDPNLPGDYNSTVSNRGNEIKNIKKIAEFDLENITTDLLSRVSADDRFALKTFCQFWNNFLSDDGESAININNGPQLKFDQNIDNPVSDDILNYIVITKNNVKESGIQNNQIETQDDIKKIINVTTTTTVTSGIANNILTIDSTPSGIEAKTVRSFVVDGIINSEFFSDINKKTLSGNKLRHNGISYLFPENSITDENYFVVFQKEKANKVREINSSTSDADFNSGENLNQGSDTDSEDGPTGVVVFPDNGPLNEDEETYAAITFINEQITKGRVLDYDKLTDSSIENLSGYSWTKTFEENPGDGKEPTKDIAYTVYGHQNDGGFTAGFGGVTVSNKGNNKAVFGLFEGSHRGIAQRVYIKTMCKSILEKIQVQEDKVNEAVSKVVRDLDKQQDTIYKQFHNIFHQWNTVVEGGNGDFIGLSDRLEKKLGGRHIAIESAGNGTGDVEKDSKTAGDEADGTFVYSYPTQIINGGKNIDVSTAIISIEPLTREDSRTTVLNMIEQICSKNNFLFIPIPGYPGALTVKEIFSPNNVPAESDLNITNYFHIVFTPTPESRAKTSNEGLSTSFEDGLRVQENIKAEALEINFGSLDNQIVKNVGVSMDTSKPTVESIINLERLSQKENQNKTVTTDCSMLSVYEGRSYTSTIDVIGNAQIFPMQFYFLRNMPLFNGLYQIMKVKHSITPNDMSTTLEGIRMRFDGTKYGGVPPITSGEVRKIAADVSGDYPTQSNDNPSTIGFKPESDLDKLHPNVRKKFKDFFKMVEQETNFKLVLTSGLRSNQEQAILNATSQGASTSLHNFGVAIDVNGLSKQSSIANLRKFPAGYNQDTISSAPLDVKKKHLALWTNSNIVKIAKDLGLGWGGDFKTNHDPVHFYDAKLKFNPGAKKMAVLYSANKTFVDDNNITYVNLT